MRILLLAFFIALLTACSGTPTEKSTEKKHTINLNQTSLVKKNLLKQFNEWKGAKYRLGGLSKKGVDCSGFVYLTFQQRLGIEIPRTTALQSKVGKKVTKKQLKSGDLVFFKTSSKVRHVGIYLSEGNFLHASTSKGVIISNLSNSYWAEKYWKSQRLTG